MPVKTRPGVPANHSSARKISSRMDVVPRSSPAMTSSASTPVPGSSGTSMCRQSVSMPSFSLRASRSAPHTASASFASSDGWKVSGPPRSIHRVAPFTDLPTPGMRVSPSPMMETASSGYAAARNSRGAERAATHMTGMPMSTPMNWTSKSW